METRFKKRSLILSMDLVVKWRRPPSICSPSWAGII